MASSSPSASSERILLFGRTGWIGGMLFDLLQSRGHEVIASTSRMENREEVSRELEKTQPTRVIIASGVTGRPNVDWCETHKSEVVRANVIGTLNVVDLCSSPKNGKQPIHCTVLATGCIYQYDDAHPIGGPGFREEDPHNYSGSFYSYSKSLTEPLLAVYPNALILRLRMPVSSDLHPRNLVSKITKYERVVNVPNSITILDDMLPVIAVMCERSLSGIFNFTNPGSISHNAILELYKKHVNPSYSWKNFTVEEQAQVLKAGRSNNELDVSKLIAAVPDIKILEVHEAIQIAFQKMEENVKLGKSVIQDSSSLSSSLSC